MTFLSPELLLLFAVILMVVAFLYSSVGHGGASGYLALMALFSFPTEVMKPTALLLNIFVAGISFWFFRRNNHFKWDLFYPFAITSIPAAFLGGYLRIDPTLYKFILAVFLAVAILRMLGVFGKFKGELRDIKLPWALLAGLLIGLFSGMIGIGGGIILSPLILLLGWGTVKQAAAVAALFIFVNSVAGIAGFTIHDGSIPGEAFVLIPVALIGGSLGAYYGSRKYTNVVLKYILSAVLTIACIKLMTV